ncbi:MAG: zinc-ribbon domain-containing protein [Methanobacteriaceae archaeon]|nr:zinc-ribbon domain-containing protein [Methanobacteriaceae archaeon]
MTIYCPVCGEDNKDDAKFCRDCGANLNEEIKKVEQSQGISESKKYIIAALIVILVCLLIFIGSFVLIHH